MNLQKKLPPRPPTLDGVLEEIGFGAFQMILLSVLLILEIPVAFSVFLPPFISEEPQDWTCAGRPVSLEEVCSCPDFLESSAQHTSIVANWQLVCGLEWVLGLAKILPVIIAGFGALLISSSSDWYGRKYCYLAVVLEMAMGAFLTALSTNPYVYLIARCLTGIGTGGYMVLVAVYASEFLPPRHRHFGSCVGFFGIGTLLLVALASHFHEWRALAGAANVPYLVIPVVFLIIPESPRWLLQNLKIEKCHKVLNYMAAINRKNSVELEVVSSLAATQLRRHSVEGGTEEFNGFSRLSILRSCKILWKGTMRLQGLWLCWALVYAGIVVAIMQSEEGLHFKMLIMASADVLGCAFALALLTRFDRQKTILGFMILTSNVLGILAILQFFLEESDYRPLFLTLYALAKFGAAGAFGAMKVMTVEFFPTSVRTMGSALACVSICGGVLVSPQIFVFGRLWPSAPLFMWAVFGFGGAFISCVVPDRTGLPLEENVEVEGPSWDSGPGVISKTDVGKY